MKIVHINTHDTGGAAAAAYRLHSALKADGISSTFLVLYNSGKYEDTVTFRPSFYHFLYKKIVRKLKSNDIKYPPLLEIFSSPDTIYDVLTNSYVQQADIIHFHWVSNFVDFKTFFKRNIKPLVWTFHDKNPFMGGFHYSLDKINASYALLNCDQDFKAMKIRAIKSCLKPLVAITPSSWLSTEVQNSEFSKLFSSVNVIHYGLPLSNFELIAKPLAKLKLGLDLSKTHFLIIASDLNNYRKGVDLVLKTIEIMQSNTDVAFILVGKLANYTPLANTTYLGSIDDCHLLNYVYCAADATLMSSREDNLPNTMIESLVCGTPVLGFSIGGLTEIIISGSNGFLTEELTIDGIIYLIVKFLNLKSDFSANRIREDAIEKFDNKIQVARVKNIYQSVVYENM